VVCSRRVLSRTLTFGVTALAISIGVAACGGGQNDTAGENAGSYPVYVYASFPATQHLAQQTHMVVQVTNTGRQTLPDVAVTITNPKYGTAAQSFGTLLAASQPGQPVLAGRSRPVWIIDQDPGPCQYSCKQGGPGAAASAFSDTWALGRLAPGKTVKFNWTVTAVQPGSYTIAYSAAAGLSPEIQTRGRFSGKLNVTISAAPRQAYVNNAGKVVYTN
jgi:hypothetical protein